MISGMPINRGIISSYYQQMDNLDKIEVPVPSSLSVYAQFKYVRGVPASSNQEPVSLSRAQIIDNMVSYLSSSPEKIQLDSKEESSMGELEHEVYRVVNQDKANFNTLPGTATDTGIIFSLIA